MFIYDLSFFLTSTAFVPTNAKYGIPLSRYTVFFENCPLERGSKEVLYFYPIRITLFNFYFQVKDIFPCCDIRTVMSASFSYSRLSFLVIIHCVTSQNAAERTEAMKIITKR